MLTCFTTSKPNEAIVPISLVTVSDFPAWLANQSDATKAWLKATQFRAEAGSTRLIANEQGQLARVICCLADQYNFWQTGALPFNLPEGYYEFDATHADDYHTRAVAWGLGAYQFTRYKKPLRAPAVLCLPSECCDAVTNTVESIYLVRDCINTPTDDMGPSELSAVMQQLAAQYQAEFKEIVGDELLKENYACIHTVGRASDDAPRLLDLRWGNPSHPKVTLVGKGVCFDTGGLDLKGSSYMLLMKKDMGGAAHALGLARMIMQANLPLRLRVLIPAVENAVSGNAYRPGDVIKSRKGLTIEVGNTDAEGRLVLADALTEAVSEEPALLIDLATLTGAARVAVGTDLAALFSNNDEVAQAVLAAAHKTQDPMWRLPLFAPYRELINSPIADINNNASEPYAGAITAALFLQEFVPTHIPWLHYDIMAWNTKTRPGRPQGGEAMALRALFQYLEAFAAKRAV